MPQPMPETWIQLGAISLIVMAVKTLFEMVMNAYTRHEWKKNGGNSSDLFTADPETGNPIRFPALNLRLLLQVLKHQDKQAEVLCDIVEKMRAHDEPVDVHTDCLAFLKSTLITPDAVQRAVRTEISRSRDLDL